MAGWVYTTQDLTALEFENTTDLLKLLNAMGKNDGRGWELVMVTDLPDDGKRLYFKQPS